MATAQEKRSADLARIQAQWENLKNNDRVREELIEELFSMLAESKLENSRLQTEVDTLKFHERNFIIERKQLKEENDKVTQSLNASPFILTVIDGDSTLFNDELLKKGAEGGHQAAQNLQDKLSKYGKELVGTQVKLHIVIRIYVNLAGLLRVYLDAGIVPTARVFQDFIVGFNRELPLSEIVDVGSDKEAADNKVKANLSLYWENEHCRHILLAGSADTGYVGFLRQFSVDEGAQKRLTLIETVPFPANFKSLSARFHVTRFDGLFRTTKINLEASAEQTPRSPMNSYATVIGRLPQQRPSSSSQIQPDDSTSKKISYNKHGQRIDDALPRYNNDDFKWLEQERYCPQFILSHCSNPRCRLRHDATVEFDEFETNALLRVARSYPCPSGIKCNDRNCLAAHQCSYGSNCFLGEKCRFTPAMHKVDKTIVKVV